MYFQNVLVPYDDSEHAQSALHVAFGMVGNDPDATIHVITVMASGPFMAPMPGGSVLDEHASLNGELGSDDAMGPVLHSMRHELQQAVDGARDGAACRAVVHTALAPSPVEGIAAYVDDHDIDLVVMGRRGLGALRGMLGSVSFGVLRSVDVPVLTVK